MDFSVALLLQGTEEWLESSDNDWQTMAWKLKDKGAPPHAPGYYHGRKTFRDWSFSSIPPLDPPRLLPLPSHSPASCSTSSSLSFASFLLPHLSYFPTDQRPSSSPSLLAPQLNSSVPTHLITHGVPKRSRGSWRPLPAISSYSIDLGSKIFPAVLQAGRGGKINYF